MIKRWLRIWLGIWDLEDEIALIQRQRLREKVEGVARVEETIDIPVVDEDGDEVLDFDRWMTCYSTGASCAQATQAVSLRKVVEMLMEYSDIDIKYTQHTEKENGLEAWEK